ncbi:MAG: Holliday junction resolvase RuvX [Clostridiaceae bacterium]
MRILGLDVGDRRIGIAVSDPTGLIATGLNVLKRTSLEEDLKEILKYVEEYKVDAVVSGLPKNMDGTTGFQANKVLDFLEELKKVYSGKIITWDERLTTVSAHRLMAEKKTKINKRKQEVDKIAACYILQGYLDSGAFKKE